jgi:hypothetical protein
LLLLLLRCARRRRHRRRRTSHVVERMRGRELRVREVLMLLLLVHLMRRVTSGVMLTERTRRVHVWRET